MFSYLRFYLSLWLGKLTALVAVLSRRGAGGTWPGHLALQISPGSLSFLEGRLLRGSILISGTNGKTTTAALIKAITEASGETVVTNPTGANLLSGLASALIKDADLFGRPRSTLAVFEVDEGNLPYVLNYFTPELIVLLNLSRDQLDRYGEIETILERWQTALLKLPKTTRIILREDDPHFKSLTEILRAAKYPLSFFSLRSPANYSSPLVGSFNQLNTNAAVLSAQVWNVPDTVTRQALADFRPVFGRGEELKISEKRVRIMLAKNPASFNENLKLIRESLPEAFTNTTDYPTILLVLNDNIPDGRDVSWIYDIDFEANQSWLSHCPLLCSGQRAFDLALRLKYADLPIPTSLHRVSTNLKKILTEALATTKNKETLYVLPTYSAMLEVRKILTGKGIG